MLFCSAWTPYWRISKQYVCSNFTKRKRGNNSNTLLLLLCSKSMLQESSTCVMSSRVCCILLTQISVFKGLHHLHICILMFRAVTWLVFQWTFLLLRPYLSYLYCKNMYKQQTKQTNAHNVFRFIVKSRALNYVSLS